MRSVGCASVSSVRWLAVSNSWPPPHCRLAQEVAERFGGASGSSSSSSGRTDMAVKDADRPTFLPGEGATSSPLPAYTPDNFAYGSTPLTSWLQVRRARVRRASGLYQGSGVCLPAVASCMCFGP